jgi:hypothetical protein
MNDFTVGTKVSFVNAAGMVREGIVRKVTPRRGRMKRVVGYDLMVETHPAFPPTAVDAARAKRLVPITAEERRAAAEKASRAVDASLRDLLRLAVQFGGAK